MHIPNPFRPIANLYRGMKLLASTSYEGASITRRMRTWGINAGGPNSTINDSLATLKYRARTLDRNNPNASGGLDSLVSTIIGRGLTPRWDTGSAEVDARILDLWKLSVPEFDASVCNLDFYGMQTLATTAMAMSGGVLGHFVYSNTDSDLTVPFRVKLLEVDHLYDSYDQPLPNGNKLRMGHELSPNGKIVAYHVYPEHPGDNYLYSKSIIPIRVLASDMVHMYVPRRPGQLQGIPWLTQVITGLHSIDEYDDAERIRKKIATMYAGFITTPTGDPSISGLPGLDTEYSDGETTDDDLVGLEPGIMQNLLPGEKIEWSKPADVGDTFEPWMQHNLRQIAKSLKITYEQLTGDLRNVNYSSIRAGLVEIYRQARALQNQIIVHKFCRPITTRWLDIAVISNRIFIPRYYQNRKRIINNIWDPDGWDWVDPLKDIKAEILAIRAGLKSRSQSVGERGHNTAEIDDSTEKDNARADGKRLIYDSDPRKSTQTGGAREKPQPKPQSQPRTGGNNTDE